MIDDAWEYIDKGTRRLRVPGGWLYQIANDVAVIGIDGGACIEFKEKPTFVAIDESMDSFERNRRP